MHAVQCGEEGQVLSDFCFVGELRVDVLTGVQQSAAGRSQRAELLANVKNPRTAWIQGERVGLSRVE